MVSFKRTLFWGLALAVSARVGIASPTPNVDETAPALDKRQGGRSTLQFSPQGRFLFTLAFNIPPAIYDSLTSSGANVANQLAYDFKDWCRPNNFDAWSLLDSAESVFGGIWSKQAGGGSTFGIVFQYFADPDLPFGFDLATIRGAFEAWTKQDGGSINAIERANNFIDLVSIGATFPHPASKVKPRSQEPYCPTENKDLLQYAVGDKNVEEDLRYIDLCWVFRSA
ncbi:MAG: hypothetical protein Q9204_004913 [Flavoplaca sp. TL-2023a]